MGKGADVAPDALQEYELVQRRAEIIRAYAERPLGQPLQNFLEEISLKRTEWNRCMTNRTFRSNIEFADRQRVRFSTQHINDSIAEVLDVQFNLALRGDSAATSRIMQVANLLNNGGGGGGGHDYDPGLVESFQRHNTIEVDLEQARKKDAESRQKLDEMLGYLDGEEAEAPPDLTRRDEDEDAGPDS